MFWASREKSGKAEELRESKTLLCICGEMHGATECVGA